MSWEQTIDILTIIGLFTGIVFAAYYQRATVVQMKRQTDATVESLAVLNAQSAQMHQQTKEMRESMQNESRPVLFATLSTAVPRALIIGNHGRNPASNVRIELQEPLQLLGGELVDSMSSPILPGGSQLVIELDEPSLDVMVARAEKSRSPGKEALPIDFVLSLTIRYRDAISEVHYVQHLQAEEQSGHSPIRLESRP